MSDGVKPYTLEEFEQQVDEMAEWAAEWPDESFGRLRATVEALEKAETERDELRRLQQVWLMSPEAAQRLDGYRQLAEKCATLEAERDEARAEVARLQDLHTRCAAFDDQPGPSCVTLKAEVARLRMTLEDVCGYFVANGRGDHPVCQQARTALAGTSDKEGR